MREIRIILCAVLVVGAVLEAAGQEKTTFQTAAHWKRSTDIRSDVVMVYGANDRPGESFVQRVQTWRDRGYTTHFMTGIAWGEYQDYFTGQWDGKWHMDEGQCSRQDTVWHGPMVPYIVPTQNYLDYFKQRHLKPVIDAGIDAIFLEEPEFWAQSGYSDAFKREWEAYYGFAWRPQHESAENTYLSNKLKYHLYYRALDQAGTYCKEYGQSRGMEVRCYVPTHSLVNYAQWGIVSPEASLASLPCIDGYIAQVWTGTSRVANYFDGVSRERVFEAAFLEYGCMESMTAPTGRKMFFLTDPIEDYGRDWEDYKRNYQATFTAQLLYPHQNNYEVMPWPDRIYEGLYKVSANSEEKARIPRFYSTQMQVMVNTLNDMPLSDKEVEGTQGIRVLMANSLMFQRSPKPVEGYDDPQLSNFFGMAMPLLKRGIPVGITHLENVQYADTWKDTKVLIMTYSSMKPLEPEAHTYIADWVKKGGTLIYCGRDDDPYQRVYEWWNQQGNTYTAPSQHLFEQMQMPAEAKEGVYTYGRGRVYVLRQDPKEFVLRKGGDKPLMETLSAAYGKGLVTKNWLQLRRGAYLLTAVMEESTDSQPQVLNGKYIDLFDPELPILTTQTVRPGEQSFLLDISRVKNHRRPQVLATSARVSDEVREGNSYRFTCKSPENTTGVMRILLPKEPTSVEVSTEAIHVWDPASKTLWLQFENNPDGVGVCIK